MGFFDKFSKKDHSASLQQIIEAMLHIAQKCMEQNDYAKAVEMYKSILQLQQNAAAQYNLGSLYAQGKGVARDFLEAGYWFRQAELSGDSEAGKMCTKCLMDHVQRGMGDKTAKDVYEDMTAFVRHVYPDRDAAGEVNRNLVELAQFHLGKRGFATAGKLLRAAAEFGADANAQNFLGVLYNAGMGVEENDLAALYWFDKAADQGIEKALADRDGILNAYRNNLSSEEFYDDMARLSGWCAVGSADVPKGAQRAQRWQTVAAEAAGKPSTKEDVQSEQDELDENILRIISELKERIQKTAPIRPGQRARFSYSNQNQLLHFGYIGVKCFGIDPECDDEFKGYRLLLEAECKYSGERRSDSVQYPFKSEEELFAFMDDPCGFPAACKKLVMRTHADRSPASAAEKDENTPDKQVSSQRWNETTCMIVRLAFCGKVYRKDDHFAVRIGSAALDLPGAKTLIDVCLQYYTLADSVQKKIESEYNRTWNTAHVLELVQNPAPYLPQMEQVYAQLLSEAKQMQDRPSVPQELFWLCPRRTALLALQNAEKDLNNVR